MDRKINRAFYGFLVLLILFFISMCGCSSMKKSQQYKKSSHDSTAAELVKISTVKTIDSIAVKTNKTLSIGSTVIEFDGDGIYVPGDELIDADDYKPVKMPINIIHLPGGGKIETSQKIKSIVDSFISSADSGDSTELHKKDTGSTEESKTVKVSDKDETSTSSKRKTNWNALIVTAAIVLLIILIIKRFTKQIQ